MLGKWLLPLVSWTQILSILVVHATKLLLTVVVLAVGCHGYARFKKKKKKEEGRFLLFIASCPEGASPLVLLRPN